MDWTWVLISIEEVSSSGKVKYKSVIGKDEKLIVIADEFDKYLTQQVRVSRRWTFLNAVFIIDIIGGNLETRKFVFILLEVLVFQQKSDWTDFNNVTR